MHALDGVAVTVPADGRFWIAPTATLIGNISLAEDASVWFGAVLRGDNEPISIGSRSNIQDGAVLHTDPGFPLSVEADCTIGHMAMLHGCRIGRGSLVGIGAIVLNGAVIGAECLVGAGTLIAEGKSFPPRSLILGQPGRAVRTMSDEDVARIERGTAGYVANWRRYKAGLGPAA
jgi:carbonic anhydrase/acetyltransferase-like protein (isoleucine patch superfamily)